MRGQSSSTAWWTTTAFTNYLQYITAVYQGIGLKSMLWQVPEGNTLYLSENNTSYHYQDNRPQYFLLSGNVQNIASYISGGVIGLLFGGGQSTGTDYMDYANDGITNPPAIDGNTLVASYPDDDGGFLRTASAAYYAAGPIALTSSSAPTASLTASPTSITAGQSSTLSWNSGNATSCRGSGFTASGLSGSVTVSPTATAGYSITCTDAAGSASAGATVRVRKKG